MSECTCHLGHPPCGYCTEQWAEEDAEIEAAMEAYLPPMELSYTPASGKLAESKDVGDYLTHYGKFLTERITRMAKPLHDPLKDVVEVAPLLRTPFDGQAHVITAGVRALRTMKPHWVIGEIGSGKTLLAQAIAHSHAKGRNYRALVFCPPHLAAKWEREIHDTLLRADVTQLESYRDAAAHDWRAPLKRPHWFIVTNTMAKLGQPWLPVYHPGQLGGNDGRGKYRLAGGCRSRKIRQCPRCMWPLFKIVDGCKVYLTDKELAARRRNCDNCGEQLWTWERKFDRWPVASYIARKARRAVDYLILDEVHECKGDDTEIAIAMSQLASSSKKVIALTGTLLGGQADHVRSLLFRLAASSIRAEGFEWENVTAFSEKYGRIERVVTTKGDKGKSMKYARATSCRTIKKIRPGVMPTLYGAHLIGLCSFLRLEDIASELPPRPVDEVITVPMDDELRREYELLEQVLGDECKRMLAMKDTRLLGTMLHTLLSYPDRPWDFGEIGYMDKQVDPPEWRHVITPANLPQDLERAKETALKRIIEEEYAKGRQCWVYCNYTDRRDTIPRLQHLVRSIGINCKVLRSSVPTRKREEWIAAEAPGTPVMISHPMLVRTGLDLFDRRGSYNFPTLIWYSTGYDLFTLRQASGRAWRIGQPELCRTIYLGYEGTMQTRALSIMGQKLVASESVEGKFSTEGLAALVGDDMSMEVALAKSLVEKIEETDPRNVWNREAARVIQRVPQPLRRTLRPEKRTRQLDLFN